MKMTPTTLRTQFSVVLLAGAILTGCKSTMDQAQLNKQFQPDDEPRAVNNYFNEQTAIASREDAMLYPCHFTAGKLNSLGRAKLAMMTGGPEGGKSTIYLNVPQDEGFSAEQSSVTDYLAKRGLATTSYTLLAGPNPSGGAPAGEGLAGLSKQESGTGAGDGTTAAAAPASAH